MAEKLPNQPLAEAILEIHWVDASYPIEEGTQPRKIPVGNGFAPELGIVDANHSAFFSRMVAHTIQKYPHMRPLPSASLPENMASHIVQYQFWVGEGEWPVLQFGPGILTINASKEYEWDDFFERCSDAIHLLFDVHPSIHNIRIKKISLKYMNTINFDFLDSNVINFLSEKMHTNIQFPSELFNGSKISSTPRSMGLRTSFNALDPKGAITLSIQTAQLPNGENCLMWENEILSSGTDVPNDRNELPQWILRAHNMAEHCFQTLSRGDLERSFKNA